MLPGSCTEDTNRQYQELLSPKKEDARTPQALQEALSGITNGYGSASAVWRYA